MYTNVLKLSRMLNHTDDRTNPPVHQVVFYQSGIGSEKNLYSQYVQGATGASLGMLLSSFDVGTRLNLHSKAKRFRRHMHSLHRTMLRAMRSIFLDFLG